MKLIYRGIEYDYTPPAVQMNDAAEVGKYRGVDVRFRKTAKSPVQQPTLDLIYRGVAYQTQQAAPVEADPQPMPMPEPTPAAIAETVGVDAKARTMLLNHHRSVKRRQQAMLSRLAKDVGLDADASKYWNHIQGKVHPSFWATYDRSRAASS